MYLVLSTVELVADCNSGSLNVKLVGPNPCTAKNNKLKQNDDLDLNDGDCFELLENQYPYKVEFSLLSNTSPDMVDKQTTLNHFLKNKRKIAEDGNDNHSQAKKMKEEYTWEEFDNGDLIVFTTHGVQHKSKVSIITSSFVKSLN